MSYQPDPKYFNWGGAFQEGIQQSQDNKRQNALMDLEQRQFGLQEKQFGMQENKLAYEKELTERSRRGRVAGLTYFGLPPEMAEQVADDEDFPELFMQITGGGSATAPAAQRLAQWLANEATPRERAALEYTIRANQGKMVDVNGVPTMVNANLNQMPNFDSLGPPRGYSSGGAGLPTMDPYEPPAEMLDIPPVPFVPPLAGGPRPPARPVQPQVAPPQASPPQAPRVAATGKGGGRITPLSTPEAEANAKASLAASGEVGKLAVARMDKMYEDATSGLSELQAISEAKRLLDQGIIAGTAGNIRLGFGRALATAGIGSGDEVARTDAYLAATAGLVAKVIKEFGAGTGLSDADREYAAKMAAGQIQLTTESMRKILEIRNKAAVARIKRYNKQRETISSRPGFESVGDLYDPIDTSSYEAATDPSKMSDEELLRRLNGQQ